MIFNRLLQEEIPSSIRVLPGAPRRHKLRDDLFECGGRGASFVFWSDAHLDSSLRPKT